MAHTFVPDVDRLPWLPDERVPRRTGHWWKLALALLLIGGAAVIGFRYGLVRTQAGLPVGEAEAPSEVTAALPAPSAAEPRMPVVEPAPMPQVDPAPVPAPVVLPQQRDVRMVAQRERRTARRSAPRSRSAPVAKVAPVKTAERKALSFSNPWESADASGRMVRVGTYATLKQGKQAWSRLARVYPAMKRLPAVVTDIPSMRDGRVYYRLQIGTTSQAHSEVLCQRMKAIGQSCVVVDLAGARRGSGDERQPVSI